MLTLHPQSKKHDFAYPWIKIALSLLCWRCFSTSKCVFYLWELDFCDVGPGSMINIIPHVSICFPCRWARWAEGWPPERQEREEERSRQEDHSQHDRGQGRQVTIIATCIYLYSYTQLAAYPFNLLFSFAYFMLSHVFGNGHKNCQYCHAHMSFGHMSW